MVVLYDPKQAGESMSRPWYRSPPLNKLHIRKLIGAVLAARGKKQGILDNDVYVIMDAMRHGNEGDLMSAFLNSDGKLMTKDNVRARVWSERAL